LILDKLRKILFFLSTDVFGSTDYTDFHGFLFPRIVFGPLIITDFHFYEL